MFRLLYIVFSVVSANKQALALTITRLVTHVFPEEIGDEKGLLKLDLGMGHPNAGGDWCNVKEAVRARREISVSIVMLSCEENAEKHTL